MYLNQFSYFEGGGSVLLKNVGTLTTTQYRNPKEGCPQVFDVANIGCL